MRTYDAGLLDLARSLLGKGGPLESSAGGDPIAEPALRDALARHAAGAAGAAPLEAKAAAAGAVGAARRALGRAGGGTGSGLSDDEVAGLEAIVQVLGRPAMRFRGGRVEMPPNALGDNARWQVLVATARSRINDVSAAVGRLSAVLDGGDGRAALGTAWRLGADLLVTNRHVAAALVADAKAPAAEWRLDPARKAQVDFAFTDDPPPPAGIGLAALVYCAPEQAVDLAVLRLAGGGAAPPPAAPALDWSGESLGRELPAAGGGGAARFQGTEVYVVGHPLHLRATGDTRSVFGAADGRKRCSPGFVTRVDAALPALEHDCSTLGGNSGSCVFSVDGHAVIGLHVGGRQADAETRTRAEANFAVALARLGEYAAARVLRGAADGAGV